MWPVDAGSGVINYPFAQGSTFFFRDVRLHRDGGGEHRAGSGAAPGARCGSAARASSALQGDVRAGWRQAQRDHPVEDGYSDGRLSSGELSGCCLSEVCVPSPVNVANLPLVEREGHSRAYPATRQIAARGASLRTRLATVPSHQSGAKRACCCLAAAVQGDARRRAVTPTEACPSCVVSCWDEGEFWSIPGQVSRLTTSGHLHHRTASRAPARPISRWRSVLGPRDL